MLDSALGFETSQVPLQGKTRKTRISVPNDKSLLVGGFSVEQLA